MTTVRSVSVTARGQALAGRLPFPTDHGHAVDAVRRWWGSVDGLVLFLATGAAVRIIAPLLTDKGEDPGVVCVDEAGRWAIALCGGHTGGANRLARQVAALLGAEPVLTTATESAGMPGLDDLPGLVATGDVAGVGRALLDGEPVVVDNRGGWPLPRGLAERLSDHGDRTIVVTDRVLAPRPGRVGLHPPSLVVGVGTSSGAPVTEAVDLLAATLHGAGLAPESVAEVATIDRRANHPAVLALGRPVRSFPADVLAAVAGRVPTPSAVVEGAVGTPSVAEAAALIAAGEGGMIAVPKRVSAHATVAVARRARPRGWLRVVGLGPGGPAHRTPAATAAVSSAEVVIGYGPYVDQCADAIAPAAEVVRSPIGDETARADDALAGAAAGRGVVLVSSGDAGVYAMASLVFERLPAHPGVAADDIEVVPGVTAALAAAAALGAPLGHDHAAISLSDLMTPWPVIERRLQAAADGDLVVTLYNPRSARRDWQLAAARKILASRRPATTPVGVVTDAGRPGQHVVVTTLGELDPGLVGMSSCLIVGSSTTRVVAGRIVTPRGYLGGKRA